MTTTPVAQTRSNGWGLWLRWMTANMAGAVLALALGVLLWFIFTIILYAIGMPGLFGLLAPFMVFGLIGALGMGIIGTLQWFALRRYIQWAGKWPLASVSGGALAGVLSGAFLAMSVCLMLGGLDIPDTPFAVFVQRVCEWRAELYQMAFGANISDHAILEETGAALVALLIVATMQRLVLRCRLPLSGWYVLATLISGLLGGVLAFFDVLSLEWAIIVMWVLNSMATGVVLIWLLRLSYNT